MTKETLDGIQKNINSSLAKTKKRLDKMAIDDQDDYIGKPVTKGFNCDLDPRGHKTICEKVKINFTPGVGSKSIDLQKAIGKMVGKANKTAMKVDVD
jgi:hypothetical protein